MKKVLMTIGFTLGVLVTQNVLACETGQEGIGYQNNNTSAAATVSIVNTTTSAAVFTNTTVNAGSFFEFCWPTNSADTFQITQTFSNTQYINYTAEDFKTNNYYINVTSDQAGWTTQ